MTAGAGRAVEEARAAMVIDDGAPAPADRFIARPFRFCRVLRGISPYWSGTGRTERAEAMGLRERLRVKVGGEAEAPARRMARRLGDTLTDVAKAAADAEAFCLGVGAGENAALRIGLALDELAANALIHGAVSEQAPEIDVEVWADDARAHLRVDARGPRFDPREPRRTAAADDLAIGGRGLTIVMAFADELAYARVEGRNVTTVSFALRDAVEAEGL